jgi:hypothetical protein
MGDGVMPDVTERPAVAACSFCRKPNTAVAALVAGPGVFICNECVALCTEVIEGRPASVPQLAPWEQAVSAEEALAHLPLVAAASTQVEQSLAGWVQRARTLGATWAQIGNALGMTRQSAWERFSGEE